MKKRGNKIKIIDLLNKIANGEEVPQKVLCDENEYSYVGRNRFFAKYIREPFDARTPYYLFTDVMNLYDEVEIIEEPRIKKLDLDDFYGIDYNDAKYMFAEKINEIIDYFENK